MFSLESKEHYFKVKDAFARPLTFFTSDIVALPAEYEVLKAKQLPTRTNKVLGWTNVRTTRPRQLSWQLSRQLAVIDVLGMPYYDSGVVIPVKIFLLPFSCCAS